MSHGFKLAFLALSLSLGASGAMATDDPAMICDISAGSPQDLDLPEGVTGIAFDALNPTDDVEAACLAASRSEAKHSKPSTHTEKRMVGAAQLPRTISVQCILPAMASKSARCKQLV